MSIVGGLGLSALTCYGAYEYAIKLEGHVSYLVIAAPAIALAAALIPPLAEHTWRQGEYLKGVLWWVVLVPAAATVFFAAAERVHMAKAVAEAERLALRKVVQRAEEERTTAKAAYEKASKEADPHRAVKDGDCKGVCPTRREAEKRTKAEYDAVEEKLKSAEKKAVSEASIKAPVWLLPAALDLIAFMAIWTGLSSGSSSRGRRPSGNGAAKPRTNKGGKKAKGKTSEQRKRSAPRAFKDARYEGLKVAV
jgi:hypothetical protein